MTEKDLIKLLADLSSNKNLMATTTVTLKESAKGAALCGTTAFVGGLIGGPVGIAVGGVIGGAAGWKITNGNFRSLSNIILNDLTPEQHEILLTSVLSAVQKISVYGVAQLIAKLRADASVHDVVLEAVTSCFTSQLGYSMMN